MMFLTKNSFRRTVHKKPIALFPWKFLKTKFPTKLSCLITNDRGRSFLQLNIYTYITCHVSYVHEKDPSLIRFCAASNPMEYDAIKISV